MKDASRVALKVWRKKDPRGNIRCECMRSVPDEIFSRSLGRRSQEASCDDGILNIEAGRRSTKREMKLVRDDGDAHCSALIIAFRINLP